MSARQPPIVFWFKIYTGALSLLYLFCVALGVRFFFFPSVLAADKMDSLVMGGLMMGLGLVLFVATLLPLLLKPRPWVWVYDLVVICFGLTSVCCLPASIPLLIFWIKPETKRYFMDGTP